MNIINEGVISRRSPPYMLQLEVMSKKIENYLGSRLGRKTGRGNMFGSIFLGGSFLMAGVVLCQHEAHFCGQALYLVNSWKTRAPRLIFNGRRWTLAAWGAFLMAGVVFRKHAKDKPKMLCRRNNMRVLNLISQNPRSVALGRLQYEPSRSGLSWGSRMAPKNNENELNLGPQS